MDRARAAGYIDNNFVQNQQRQRARQDHLNRIRKIKNRKPGSSVTLDNNPPDVIDQAANDPRKKNKGILKGVIIERENKVLLQRISAILTEPAKDTVKEYYAMKKLVVSKHTGKVGAAERFLKQKANQKFFGNLKKQRPVYSVKRWEEEYQTQKYQQRFMREVKYERPEGFVDPFSAESIAARQAEEEAKYIPARKRNKLLEEQGGEEGGEGEEGVGGSGSTNTNSPNGRSTASSAAHVDRVRAIKSTTGGSIAMNTTAVRPNVTKRRVSPPKQRNNKQQQQQQGTTGGSSGADVNTPTAGAGSTGEYDDFAQVSRGSSAEYFAQMSRGSSAESSLYHHHSHSQQQPEELGGGGEGLLGVSHNNNNNNNNNYYGREEDEYFEQDDDEEEWKTLLATDRKEIRISEEREPAATASAQQHQQRHTSTTSSAGAGAGAGAGNPQFNVYTATADITCWLVNGEAVVLNAFVLPEDDAHHQHQQQHARVTGRGISLEAEAEITLEDLAVLRGEEPSMFGSAAAGLSEAADGDE
eukprot:CAMPEP_0175019550 /NCGR_PEP_ID=MMETSP0005-20121125/13619_1 /TAXON_ID=420556 /ORGANISM="Ochromonas sp., Strain CCMP1393" /LENGTH=527 /DNA_ID=CAMNT_0016277295 /DNA_START=44 /DNA_END=1624 /DNA_ORIENTATION=-